MKEEKMLSYCKACQDKLQETLRVEIDSPACCGTSSTASFSSHDGSVSISSDTSIDGNFFRDNQEGISNASSPKCLDWQTNGTLQNSEQYNAFDNLSNQSIESFLKGVDSNNGIAEQHVKESSSDHKLKNTCHSMLHMDDTMNLLMLVPPEPDNPYDDVDGSLTLNDDDEDDYVEGMKWGTPSSLSSIMDESTGVLRFQERQKKMEELKNGKFLVAVSQFLKREIADLTESDVITWLNTIVHLSWDAALFLRPDSDRETTLDPNGYVKVKCIAGGHPSESHLVKGLVFNKHAAHKHMITKLKNPRLLLISGSLGQSSNVLSSFTSMEQENENMKSLMELIERCKPNLVLVEKSVSRDIQELMLAKGVTLIYDMKFHRLQRIARCTGSPIFSSESLTIQNLRTCDSFHIEKFVEEHALSSEGGKKPNKTLLFVEGSPTHLGCTILLKGSYPEELKRIKNVVLYAAIVAFNLIVETSFIMDCEAMLSSVVTGTESSVSTASGSDDFISAEKCPTETEIPIIEGAVQNGTDEVFTNLNVEPEDSLLFTEPYNPAILSGLSSISTSLKRVLGRNFPRSSSYYQSLSSFLLVNPTDKKVEDAPFNKPLEESDEAKVEVHDDLPKVALSPSSDKHSSRKADTHEVDDIDDGFSFLNSRNTLVLKSTRNSLRGIICDPNRYYRNLDFPLCKFLRENLFDQRRLCSTCGDSPESHVYYYTHRDKQLIFRIQRLANDLHGNSERKTWMWSRCGRCKYDSEVPISTKRVLVSALGGNLPFGRFIELSFSRTSGIRPICGHSLENDFYFFFGEGQVAAMLKYSALATYTVSLPPTMLEFNKYSFGDRTWFLEIRTIYERGMHLFNAIWGSLRQIDTQLFLSNRKRLSSIAEMLKHDVSEFETNIRYAATTGTIGKLSCIPLTLNWVIWGLLLREYIWNFRLHVIQASRKEESSKINCIPCVGKMVSVTDDTFTTLEPAYQGEQIPVFGSTQISEDKIEKVSEENLYGCYNMESITECNGLGSYQSLEVNHQPGLEHCSSDEMTIKIFSDSENCDLTTKTGLASINGSEDWLWKPSSEIQRMYAKDLQQGLWPKFQQLGDNDQKYFVTHPFISEEGSRIHVPLGEDPYMVRDYDGEHSSVIACALAYLNECPSTESLDNTGKDSFISKSSKNLQIFARVPTMILSDTALGSFTDVDSLPSNLSISHSDSRLSSFDGLNLLESLIPVENQSPEVNLGVTKAFPKGKYSVICLFANQFSELRNRCFPSEVEYIASLSRCKYWDAKGGKSRSTFSKTHDDRFIIKEIKKIEFDSFLKFAPHYFKYMKESIETGSQSCLAKILGIYQVIIRPSKGSKEVRHDLMVMENLSYGRKVTRQYDLKGALHARFTSVADNEADVLLDQNFVKDMTCSPLYVSKKTKRLLERAVWNDTCFLNSINVMDYSLLVGVDTDNQVLNCGIIDYLRQYTWDKQLETWVKSSLVVPKNVQPTVISPIEYKKRFRKFMSKYFLSIPDDWCTEYSHGGTCDLCGCKIGSSTRSKSAK